MFLWSLGKWQNNFQTLYNAFQGEMMKDKSFVVVRESPTGFGFWNTTVYCVFEGTREEAKLFVADLNRKSRRCNYYLTLVKIQRKPE